MREIFKDVGKGILVVLGLFWVLSNAIATFAYSFTIETLASITGISQDQYFDRAEPIFEIAFLTDFFNSPFFVVFFLFSLIFSISGTLILARKRSIFTALGLFVAFILPRERIHWGIVREKHTGKRIPFAVIRLHIVKETQKSDPIESTVADTDGRYRLQIYKPKLKYVLVAEAEGFLATEVNIDYGNSNLSFIDITEEIYLQQETEGAGSISMQIKKNQFLIYKYMMAVIYAFSIIYLLTFLYYVLANPDSVYGYANLSLFVYAVARNTMIVRQRLRGGAGRVLDAETIAPIPGVMSRIVGSVSDEVALTNKQGIPRFGESRGEKTVNFFKPDYTPKELKVKIDENGFLKNDVYLEKSEGFGA